MNIYLAGTERLETDVKNMNIYLADKCKSLESRMKNDMNIHLAESGGCFGAYLKAADFYKGASILQSFYYVSDFTEQVIIPNCERFLLDSGAFTFMMKGTTVDWNDYLEQYAHFIRKNGIDLFFELDIDSVVGYEKVKEMRIRLEKMTGKQCIPVWHTSRGIDEFRRHAQEYDYIAYGGIAGKGAMNYKEQEKYFPFFISEAHKYGAKIHGLGYTSMTGIKKFHFDSVDSTSWVSGNRFGAVFKFDGKTMKHFNKPDGKRVKTSEVAIHNFLEWKKFCKYAETHL